ncbi:MAG: amidophosphoribosyltransferase [Armatimonadota bacterium]
MLDSTACGQSCQGCGDERLWRDACGVFGIYGPGEDVANITYFGLYALQHRGQEGAGIAVWDGEELHCHKGLGLAAQVFNEQVISDMQGSIALGHVRYSTTGGNTYCNTQPMIGEGKFGPFAVAHNGNLINTAALRQDLEARGVLFEATSDTEVIVKLIEHQGADTIEEAVAGAMHHMRGAYSLGIVAPGKLLGVRDPNGVRPLSIGQINGDKYVLASETCAHHVVGAEFVREVQPGEIVTLSAEGISAMQAMDPARKSCCIFEFIYFARPDSHIYGKSVYMTRLRMGHLLAQQAPVDADLVIPVPESALPHAMGYAQVSKIPYGEGLIKNRYIFRTFIAPDQRLRDLGVKMKLSPLKENLAGRRVVVVDDSIVRGTTTGPEVELLREAGAREIHLRISSPPIKYPCFYGIDTSAGRSELIAARMTVPEIRAHLDADSLEYLDIKNLVKAVGLPKTNFCTACFDRQYPIPVPRAIKVTKFDLEKPAEKTVKDGDRPES